MPTAPLLPEPPAAERWERTPVIEVSPRPRPGPEPAAVEPVTAPVAPLESTWEPVVERSTARIPAVEEPTATAPVVPPAPVAPPRRAVDEQAAARKGPWEGAPHPAFPDATARTFRILPIAADLLPLEISETRHVRRVRRVVISGVVLVAALVVGWYGVTVHEHTQAGDDRQAILDTSQDLTRQKHKQYDELTRIQSDSGKIDDRLEKALAYDLSWSKLLAALRATATAKNVTLSGVTAALSPQALSGKPEGDVIGNVTLTGKAPTKAAVAGYVDALTGVAGVANPFPTDATQETDGVSFTIRVDITRAALGGRFTSAAPSASPSGSK
jgi:Tfp pilus assembly protein PilN